MSVSLDGLLCVIRKMPFKKLLFRICVDTPMFFKKEFPDCGRLLLEMSQDHKHLL